MRQKPGPKPNPGSITRNSLKKGFFIKKDNWKDIMHYSSENHISKSHLINEALQLYFIKLKDPDEAVSNQWTVVSLFSGCGGMDLGFSAEFNFLGKFYSKNHAVSSNKTFKVLFANDILPEACAQYNSYFVDKLGEKTYLHQGDIAEFLDHIQLIPPKERINIFPETCDVVIGGFPCQDFSVAGKRLGLESARGRLYLQMKKVIELTNPKIFIAENVKGLTNLGAALEIIKNDFSNTGRQGYYIAHKLLMAANYGVPQTRERVFICGIRKDMDPNCFRFPTETHSPDMDTDLKPWVTAKDALADIPDDLPNQDQFSKARNYGSHCQGNKSIRADYPSPTIRAEHHGNIEFHYSKKRRLTVRECARIQSFPDDFIFNCSPSMAYKLLGNAVPPVLSWNIANSVGNCLENWEREIDIQNARDIYKSEMALANS
jgi:DNA (cytosine-5)-methyltransferase 1